MEAVQIQQQNGSVVTAQNTIESRIAEMEQNTLTVQRMMQSVLRDGEHYGKIPGTDRPTLLKSGAEKLLLVFRLGARYNTDVIEMQNGHREYRSDCTIFDIKSSNELGAASGSCSTMESKYRYRNVADYEVTDIPIPHDSKERKTEYRKQGYGMKKVSGMWAWVKYLDSERTENPDIADVYNTVLKMSQKRALIATTLNVLAVSDMFTQDIEDGHPLVTPHGTVDRDTGEIIDEHPPSYPSSPKPQTPVTEYKKSSTPPQITPEQSYRGLMINIDRLIENKEDLKEHEIIVKLRDYRFIWISKNHPEAIAQSGLREIDSFLAQLGHPITEEGAF